MLSEVNVNKADLIRTHTIQFAKLVFWVIVIAVLIGTAGITFLQIAERIYAANFTGAIIPFGILIPGAAGIKSVCFYGLIAAAITETSPFSWFWFLHHFVYIFPDGRMMKRIDPMEKLRELTPASDTGALPAFLSRLPKQIWNILVSQLLSNCLLYIAIETTRPFTLTYNIPHMRLHSGALHRFG